MEIFSYLPEFIIYVINMSLKLKCIQLVLASKYLLILMNREEHMQTFSAKKKITTKKQNNANKLDLSKKKHTHTLSLLPQILTHTHTLPFLSLSHTQLAL